MFSLKLSHGGRRSGGLREAAEVREVMNVECSRSDQSDRSGVNLTQLEHDLKYDFATPFNTVAAGFNKNP